jgi:signal transduction histidine kinase
MALLRDARRAFSRSFRGPDGTRDGGMNETLARLHESERRARILAEASAVFARSLDPGETLEQLAHITNGSLGDIGIGYLAGDGGELERVSAVHGEHLEQPVLDRFRSRGRFKAPPLASEVMRTGESIFLPKLGQERLRSIAIDGEHLEMIRDLRPVSALFVPLEARGRRIGVFSVVTTEGGKPPLGNASRELLEELGSRAAVSIDSALLFRAEQRARQQAEKAAERTLRLQTVTAALSRALPEAEVLDVIIHQAVDALGAEAGGVVEVTPDKQELVYLHGIGFDEEMLEHFQRFSVDLPLPTRDVMRTGKPVLVESPREWNRRYPTPPLRRGSRARDGAWAVLPLRLGGRLLGALTLSFARAQPFIEEDLDYMMALANQCAQALHRARLYEAEQEARAAAEEANEAKVEFLSAMSHELRTPLNAIAGYVDLLDLGVHGALSDAQRDVLRRIKRNQDHLLALISDILSYARPGIGTMKLEFKAVSARATLRRIEGLISPMLQGRVLVHECRCSTRALQMWCDPDRVQQILLNLVTNALNHTEENGRISLVCEGGGEWMRIHVGDDGSGIPEDRLEAIFDPFVQFDRLRRPASYRGVGLGLAISRDLAREMNGDLTVESTEGGGSIFTLSLPLSAGGGAPGP